MNKKEIKRREEKEENNKSKNYIKKEKPKNIRVLVASVHNFDPKILPEGSAKLRWAGRGQGTSYFTASAVCMWSSGKKKAFDVGGLS
jgi:hypothetical protein